MPGWGVGFYRAFISAFGIFVTVTARCARDFGVDAACVRIVNLIVFFA